MNNIVVVILTLNEEKHIERCIRSVQNLTRKILVVDSFSTDCTPEIARSLGANVIQHEFKNHGAQFQWGIEQCGEDAEWLMRLDADEYLEPALAAEIENALIPDDVTGIYIKRKVFFMGQWIRYGGFYPHVLLRIWRKGRGHIEQRWMDEHVVLQPGERTLMLKEHLVDDNRKGITFWINKHNSYASREMVDLLSSKYPLIELDNAIHSAESSQAKTKRFLKEKVYSKMPVGFRALAYFFYRYILKAGFLDGPKGFIWHFMQGFWYRLLVDVKIMELEARCQGDLEMMKKILHEEHGLQV